MSISKFIAVGVATGAAITAAYFGHKYLHKLWRHNNLPDLWYEVGEVTDLLCYPIKSCGVVRTRTMTPSKLGWHDGNLRDRVFMLVNGKTMKFVTARQYPKVVLIQPSIDGTKMTLSAPNAETLILDIDVIVKSPTVKSEVWDQMIEVHDCGDVVARWLSDIIPEATDGLRLVYYPHVIPTRPVRPKNVRPEWPHMTKDHTGAMHDASSYMMLNEASMKDLNAKLDRKVEPLWFRPSIVIKGMEPAYSEDGNEWYRFGESAVFRHVKPCSRCIFTTIDPETGVKDPNMEPLKTLRTYRKIPACGDSPIFGAHLGFVGGDGPVKVGDKVYVGIFTCCAKK